ncbi:MAG: nucleotidyltransferase domain-containing protein [Candidatus Methanoperedens sp.]|nr:nucleotidyltransferase domain-containing protein [Candidatus Methanoperedens sp.]
MNKLLEIKFGSHLYGTDTPESDLDYKSIYVPTAREIVLHTYKKVDCISRKKKHCERNNKEDVDIEVFSLDRFLDDLMAGQTWALDMFFATESSYTECSLLGRGVMMDLHMNKERLLTRNVNAFVGYARQQAAKYGIKGSRMDALKRTMVLLESLPQWDRLAQYDKQVYALVDECKELISLERTPLVEVVMVPGPNKVDMMPHLHVCGRKMAFQTPIKIIKECYGKILAEYGQRAKKAHLAGGVDWKALSHAVRVNHEALELLKTGKVTFPRPERELLLKIKTSGQTQAMEDKEVYAMIEQGLLELTEAHGHSTLRDEPDYEWANDYVYNLYSNIVKRDG